jgi:hypothetical protein
LVQAHTACLQRRARATRRPARGTGTEQQGGPPLRRAMAWPWPLACKMRSGALGGSFKSSLLAAFEVNSEPHTGGHVPHK